MSPVAVKPSISTNRLTALPLPPPLPPSPPSLLPPLSPPLLPLPLPVKQQTQTLAKKEAELHFRFEEARATMCKIGVKKQKPPVLYLKRAAQQLHFVLGQICSYCVVDMENAPSLDRDMRSVFSRLYSPNQINSTRHLVLFC